MSFRRTIAVFAAAAAGAAGLLIPATLAGAVPAPVEPTVDVEPATGAPGFEFTVSATCTDGEPVLFDASFGDNETITCTDGTAERDFVAPTVNGTFPVVVFFDPQETATWPCDSAPEGQERPCLLEVVVTVLPPGLTASPTSGSPEFDFTMTLDYCPDTWSRSIGSPDFNLNAVFPSQTTVVFVLPATGQEQEVPCEPGEAPVTSGNFTAPDTPGEFDVFALFAQTDGGGNGENGGNNGDNGIFSFDLAQMPEQCPTNQVFAGCALFGGITVNAPASTTSSTTSTTSTTPTTEAPDTTDAPAGTDAPAPTTSEVAVQPPPEEPAMTLPSTGGGDASSTALWAMLLLLGGVAAIAVAQVRRTPGRTPS